MSVLLCFFINHAHATIHYSGEKYAELPSSWKGFLADHRMMRVASIPASPKTPPSLLRLEYQAAVDRMLAEKKQRALKANELADLGVSICASAKPTQLSISSAPQWHNSPMTLPYTPTSAQPGIWPATGPKLWNTSARQRSWPRLNSRRWRLSISSWLLCE
ncbi:MAG: hypothetical protein QM703_08690 [Gemmatales bacterium]